ncbi:MAG: hypothetical protein KQJ78_04760 [Deltaproteobacteria bacterium]|nr:hypothetical protein [Deltaproteobacteria bacterium]
MSRRNVFGAAFLTLLLLAGAARPPAAPARAPECFREPSLVDQGILKMVLEQHLVKPAFNRMLPAGFQATGLMTVIQVDKWKQIITYRHPAVGWMAEGPLNLGRTYDGLKVIYRLAQGDLAAARDIALQRVALEAAASFLGLTYATLSAQVFALSVLFAAGQYAEEVRLYLRCNQYLSQFMPEVISQAELIELPVEQKVAWIKDRMRSCDPRYLWGLTCYMEVFLPPEQRFPVPIPPSESGWGPVVGWAEWQRQKMNFALEFSRPERQQALAAVIQAMIRDWRVAQLQEEIRRLAQTPEFMSSLAVLAYIEEHFGGEEAMLEAMCRYYRDLLGQPVEVAGEVRAAGSAAPGGPPTAVEVRLANPGGERARCQVIPEKSWLADSQGNQYPLDLGRRREEILTPGQTLPWTTIPLPPAAAGGGRLSLNLAYLCYPCREFRQEVAGRLIIKPSLCDQYCRYVEEGGSFRLDCRYPSEREGEEWPNVREVVLDWAWEPGPAPPPPGPDPAGAVTRCFCEEIPGEPPPPGIPVNRLVSCLFINDREACRRRPDCREACRRAPAPGPGSGFSQGGWAP